MFKLFQIFLVLLAIITSNGQQPSKDVLSAFNRIAKKYLENEVNLNLPSLSSILNPSFKCIQNNSDTSRPSNMTIINLSGKRMRAIAIRPDGSFGNGLSKEDYMSEKSNRSALVFGMSRSYFCWKLIIDADDIDSKTFIVKIPLKPATYIWGNVQSILDDISSSSWLSNTNLTMNHLVQYEKLLAFNKAPPSAAYEFELIESSYYEESSAMKNVLNAFFNSFNQSNKYVDAFFNPSNKLSEKESNSYYAARVSDMKGVVIYDPNETETLNFRQALVSDCWLLSSITAIHARYPQQIITKFIHPEMMPSTGIVAVKLWSSSKQAWRLIIMDDYLLKHRNLSMTTLGVNPSGKLKNNYWYPFIEKAFAKYTGKTKIPGSAPQIAFVKLLGSSLKKIVSIGFKGNNDSFNQLDTYFKNGSVIVFHSSSECKRNGIQCGHAYAVLDVQKNVANSGFSFVKVHNPTGHIEFIGDWNDSRNMSSLWNQYPNVKAQLNPVFADDGTFWVEQKDMVTIFGSAVVGIIG